MGLVEGHFDTIVCQQFDFGRSGAVAVSNLSFAAETARDAVDQPVEPVALQSAAAEIFARPNHDAAGFRFEPHDIARFSKRQTEPLSLPDGVTLVAVVATEHVADGVDDFASGVLFSAITFEKSGVVVVWNETDLLAVGLVVNSESRLLSLLANIRFVEVSNW